MVDTDPSLERLTSLGSNITSLNGTIFSVGTPLETDLILKITGRFLSSLVAKKTSNLVTKTPSLSSISNDCARGA